MRLAILTPMLALSALTAAASAIGAQAPSDQRVPVRELAASDAKSSQTFGNIFGVRQLAGGRVLVNDGVRRQLLVLDSNLSSAQVMLDSVAIGGQSYGPRAVPLIPYLADSTLFVDGTSLSLLVIAPNGSIARVMAAPQPGDMRYLAGGVSGADRMGNLIYRGAPPRLTQNGSELATKGAVPQAPTQLGDSAPILRANFETRQVDTLASVKVASTMRANMVQGTDGKWTLVTVINPLVTVDEWAVLSNGSVALIRGHDYHIDWVHPDGARSSSPKLPFDWKRLTDTDKQHLIDSARTEQERQLAEQKANGVNVVAASKQNDAFGGGDVSGKSAALEVKSKAAAAMGMDDVAGKKGATNVATRVEFVPLAEIADYYPALRTGAAKADLDGNLWILPTTSAQSKAGELLYDVVASNGHLTYRVRLPIGKSIAGFGKNGVVYLMTRTGQGWTLERSRVVIN